MGNLKFKSNHSKLIYVHYVLYTDITIKTCEGNPVLGQVGTPALVYKYDVKVNISGSTMDQITTCNVKGVTS